ncbi:MAG TPA: ABC transporter permease [Candidatus Aminicenantes bacterium]|nr:ABC transporter permease [Candidatus Aminicenantes bacterium]
MRNLNLVPAAKAFPAFKNEQARIRLPAAEFHDGGVSSMRTGFFRMARAVAKKELRQISRDVRTLIFLLILPGFLLLMFGYALNFDVKRVPLAVCDLDRSAASRDFADRFTHTEYFDLRRNLVDPRAIDTLMAQENVRLAVVIPSGFSKNLLSRREASIQVIVDGANAMSASTAAGYISAVVQGYSVQMTMKSLSSRGFRNVELPLRAETRVWYNPELRSANFLVPGLMAFILMVILVISTAFSIVREKERGTMEQILVSPLRSAELIVGKTIPYILISLLSSHLVLLLGNLLFGVTVKGDYFFLLLTIILFLVGGLGQGLLISTVTKTQQVAFQLAILSTFLPTFILSGFVFPVQNMPPAIQAVTYLVPAKYFLAVLRSIMLKGVGPGAFWEQMVFLLGFAVLMLWLSTARLKRAGGDDAAEGPGKGKGKRKHRIRMGKTGGEGSGKR